MPQKLAAAIEFFPAQSKVLDRSSRWRNASPGCEIALARAPQFKRIVRTAENCVLRNSIMRGSSSLSVPAPGITEHGPSCTLIDNGNIGKCCNPADFA